ncbi:mRNA-capping enzyme subunit beta [Cryptotrichosporon argae]
MPYVPFHERHPPTTAQPPIPDPTYGPPFDASMDAGFAGEPSRKRRRDEDEAGDGGDVPGYDSVGHGQGDGQQSVFVQDEAGHGQRERHAHGQREAIVPSIFGIAPRNDFTRKVGEWVMMHCRGVEHVELEIKLGTLTSDGQNRLRMPTWCETIIPPDYPSGRFSSTLNKAQHASLNRLLNSVVSSSQALPPAARLRFSRAQHTDSFHADRAGRVRVSRDRAGAVVPGGVVRKRRLADLNVVNPNGGFDFRISASVEEPAEMPRGPEQMARDKDRACYRHQLCQVDLTVVTSRTSDGARPAVSYELEIEILDVPALIAEGEKEERGEDNHFDERLQSCLDSVRMLIRNA